MANRNTMHRSHLEEFERFLLSCGYEPVRPHQYEAVRMYHPDRQGVLVVWQKVKAGEHLSIQGQSEEMFQEWRSYRNGAIYRDGIVNYFNPAHAPVARKS